MYPMVGPTPIGENVTLIVQLLPAATLLPQLFVCAKSPLPGRMLEILRGASLPFESVTF
jgi:hypothetical protein